MATVVALYSVRLYSGGGPCTQTQWSDPPPVPGVSGRPAPARRRRRSRHCGATATSPASRDTSRVTWCQRTARGADRSGWRPGVGQPTLRTSGVRQDTAEGGVA